MSNVDNIMGSKKYLEVDESIPEVDTKTIMGDSHVFELPEIPSKSDTSVDLNKSLDKVEIESETFNEVDYAAMIFNPHIRMAVRKLAPKINFDNPMVSYLRDLVLMLDTDDHRLIISALYEKYGEGSSFKSVLAKLIYYRDLGNREKIDHYLKKLNTKIKKSVLNQSLRKFLDDNDLEGFLTKIDELTECIYDSTLPFFDLSRLTLDDIKETFIEDNKLSSSIDRINSLSNYKSLLKGQVVIVAAPPRLT